MKRRPCRPAGWKRCTSAPGRPSKPGETVLINGAGGSIGTAGVQIARYYGAEMTAVDSAEKLAMLR